MIITNQIFEHFARCAKAGILSVKKSEDFGGNFLYEKFLKVEVRNSAYRLILQYEQTPSAKIYKDYELDTGSGYRATADILIYDKGEAELINVYHTAELTWHQFLSTAYTVFVANKCNINFSKVTIAIVNKDYRNGIGKPYELLKFLDQTSKVKRVMPRIQQLVESLFKRLRENSTPAIDIGYQCTYGTVCPFLKTCEKNQFPEENSINELIDLKLHQKLYLFRKGIIRYTDIPAAYALPSRTKKQIAFGNNVFIDRRKIKQWIRKYEMFPELIFLDMEYEKVLQPLHVQESPLTTYPYLFSLVKYQSEKDNGLLYQDLITSSLNHTTLHRFTERFIQFAIANDSPIIISNGARQIQIIANLKTIFPEFEKDLSDIQKRFVDLQRDIFYNQLYYHPKFNGSTYLKHVIEVIRPDFSYQHLAVKSGDEARVLYREMLNASSTKSLQLQKNLLDYSRNDVTTLVLLYQNLQQL